jgi:methionyl-tRNA formyltransferase
LNIVSRSLRLGFAGTPEFAVPALEALLRSRHRVAAVFTQPDRPAGRGRTLKLSAVKQCAARAGLQVHQPASFKAVETLATLRSLDLDALVVVAYGLILPPAALAIPKLGCFNIHASLLPRWRGAAPVQRALLAGDAVTGVTIMRMAAGLDTGPMLATRVVPIAARETAATLSPRLAQAGAELIVETLDAAANGTADEVPQPQEGATYAQKIGKEEALIDWRASAASILLKVRAFNPWPIAETRLQGAQLRIWDAELTPEVAAPDPLTPAAPPGAGIPLRADPPGGGPPGGGPPGSDTPPGAGPVSAPPGTVIAAAAAGIDVACGRGALRLERLQLAGRKALDAREFLLARRLAGVRFESP